MYEVVLNIILSLGYGKMRRTEESEECVVFRATPWTMVRRQHNRIITFMEWY
jgi:hypothetical protein